MPEFTMKPILFSGPMVRKIAADEKTQTRRLIKWTPLPGEEKTNLLFSGVSAGEFCTGRPETGHVLYVRRRGGVWTQITAPLHCRYGQKPGDRCWVRETWGLLNPVDPLDHGVPCIPDWRPTPDRPVLGRWFDPVYAADGGEAPFRGRARRWTPGIHMPRWASRYTLELTAPVRVERANRISPADARAEGFPSVSDFYEAFEAMNGPGSVDQWVWVLTFRRVNS